MIDVFKFMISCVFGFFGVLDNFILFDDISLLKVLIILSLFTCIVGLLYKRGRD